jgi:hypothetical protein
MSMKRTQISLEPRQHQFLNSVAHLASWRIQNDPFYDVQETGRVSMAEVVRFLIDSWIAYYTRPDEGLPDEASGLLAGTDPMGASATGRQQEIGHALVDTAQYLERGGELTDDGKPQEDPGRVPDSRRR